nr:monothiol glutaredoxin-S15, mitochondrial-like isoform X2 [Coffea arabica]XP_027127632.1 monothiol glutaredoxin-S15, mitochondrial-like isoform X2 [Coffea arabica]
MAWSLAAALGRSMAAVPAARSAAMAATFFCRGVICYSTTVPNDPDTHEDFRPTIKLESSGLSLKDIVEQDVKEKHVMIYMKGVPDLPRCGFSSLAVRVLKEYSVPISARNILEDLELKNAVKAYSNQKPTDCNSSSFQTFCCCC